MVKTLVGSFDSITHASQAAKALRAAGFPSDDVNVVAHDVRRSPTASRETHDEDANAAATGALAGGALGGAAGLALSLMGLAIPGIGPILAAGPIVAALAGAGAGAVAGSLIGALTEVGVSETEAGYYAEAVRRGGALVTVRADDVRVDEVLRSLREHGAFDIEDRVVQWRSEGWDGHDPNAEPYSLEEVERNRTRYHTAANG